MWLDADDVLLEDAQEALKLLKELDPKIDAVSMPYHLALDSSGNLYIVQKEIDL